MMRLFFVAALLALVAAPAPAAERVALLIGNGAYENTTRLGSPRRDVAAMAAALQALGFDVSRVADVNEREMGGAIKEFSRKAARADTALLFYSGHGMEIAGRNYLVPIDALLEREGDAGFEAIPLDAVIEAASGAKRLSVVVLDACRDNRFRGPTKSAAKGFRPIRARPGQLIAFATAPGTVAYDGDGALSPFTQALTEALVEPSVLTLDVRQLFGGLGPRTSALARGPQEPFTHAAGFGRASVTLTGETSTNASQVEKTAFNRAIKAGNVAAIDAFITVFPKSELKPQALALRKALEAAERARTAAENTEPDQRPSQEKTETPDPAVAETPTKPLSTKELARATQGELKRLGLYAPAVDGRWGPASRRAMRLFQELQRIPSTGVASEQTLLLLKSANEADFEDVARRLSDERLAAQEQRRRAEQKRREQEVERRSQRAQSKTSQATNRSSSSSRMIECSTGGRSCRMPYSETRFTPDSVCRLCTCPGGDAGKYCGD